MDGNNSPTLIASVRRALQLMEAVAESPGPPTAKQLAATTGIALPTVYHLLRTLVHDGYLERTTQRGYILGRQLETMTEQGQVGVQAAKIEAVLADLRESVHRAAYLSTFIDGRVTVTAVSEDHRTRAIEQWIAFEDVPHATALGKATLSVLPDHDRSEVLATHRLRRLTANTVIRPSSLLDEVTASPPLWLDREEYAPGVVCAAAPVTAPGAVGAVAISMPPAGLQTLRKLVPALADASKRISQVWAFT